MEVTRLFIVWAIADKTSLVDNDQIGLSVDDGRFGVDGGEFTQVFTKMAGQQRRDGVADLGSDLVK